jgi:thiamine pyrophosphokinase
MTVRHALVLADGPVEGRQELDAAWPGWADGVDLVIAADGGLRHAGTLGVAVGRWVGDADSVDPVELARIEAAGTPVDRARVDKDETDTELAILAAARAGAPRITILGALGGLRVDHELANVWLLAHPGLDGRDARLVGSRSRVRLIGPGRADLPGHVGDLVSLLPFGGDVAGIATAGLRFALRGEPLVGGPSRGISNVRDSETASVVVTSGRLLVVETFARLRG